MIKITIFFFFLLRRYYYYYIYVYAAHTMQARILIFTHPRHTP